MQKKSNQFNFIDESRPFFIKGRDIISLIITVTIICMIYSHYDVFSFLEANAETREIIVLTGNDLTLEDILKIAENRADIRVSPEGIKRIKAANDVIQYYVENKIPAYGVNTMFGSDHDVTLPVEEIKRFNRINVHQEATKIGDGSRPIVKTEVLRAAWALMVNSYARGFSGPSYELVEKIVERVNTNKIPTNVEYGGSMGDADLIMNNKLALSLFEDPDFELGPGEATTIMTHNFITISKAILLIKRFESLLPRAKVALALNMEGFRANLSPISEQAMKVTTRVNKHKIQAELQFLLNQSELWKDESSYGPRNLEDPLSIRVSSDVLATVEKSLQRLEKTLIEYSNAVPVSPMVDTESRKMTVVTEYDTSQLTLDMDQFRQALGLLSISIDGITQKTISRPFTDLPSGLSSGNPNKYDGLYTYNLSYWNTSLMREALQYSHPVMAMTASFSAEGTEDYSTPFPNSVEMAEDMIDRLEKMVTIEALIGAFAIQRRIEMGQLSINQVPVQLRNVLKEIIKRSPMQFAEDQQYSLQPLLKYFIAEYNPPKELTKLTK